MVRVKPEFSRNQRQMDKHVECFEKLVRLMDTDHPHEAAQAFQQALKKCERIRDLQGKKPGEPGAFGFGEYLRLLAQQGSHGAEIQRLQKSIERAQEQLARVTKERDELKRSSKSTSGSSGYQAGKDCLAMGGSFFYSSLPFFHQVMGSFGIALGVMVWVISQSLSIPGGLSWPAVGALVWVVCLCVPYLCKGVGFIAWAGGVVLDYLCYWAALLMKELVKMLAFLSMVSGGFWVLFYFTNSDFLGKRIPFQMWSEEGLVWLGHHWHEPFVMLVLGGNVAVYVLMRWGFAWIDIHGWNMRFFSWKRPFQRAF